MIVIDGYNLLFAQKDDVADLESARTALVELIEKFNSKKRTAIKIIFDVKSGTFSYDRKSKMEKGEVEVIFSPKGTSADDYIIKLVGESENKRGIIVVSSDREVSNGVKKLGAQTMPSDEFLKQLREFFKQDQSDDYYFEKEHGIPKAEVDYWLKVFGLDEK